MELLEKEKIVKYDRDKLVSASIKYMMVKRDGKWIVERNRYSVTIQRPDETDDENELVFIHTLDGIPHNAEGAAYYMYNDRTGMTYDEKYYLSGSPSLSKDEWEAQRHTHLTGGFIHDMLEELLDEIGI